MFGIGPMELVVIIVVALLIFGPQRLPEFARNLGKGLAEFRRASNELRQTLALDELQNDLRKTMNAPAKPVPPRPAQAGDTLPPGSSAETATSPSAPPATSQPTPGASLDPKVAAEPPWKSHPGELAFGREHEHNAPAPTEAPAGRSAAELSSDASSDASSDTSSEKGPRLAAADSGLGNVPVGGAEASDDPRRG